MCNERQNFATAINLWGLRIHFPGIGYVLTISKRPLKVKMLYESFCTLFPWNLLNTVHVVGLLCVLYRLRNLFISIWTLHGAFFSSSFRINIKLVITWYKVCFIIRWTYIFRQFFKLCLQSCSVSVTHMRNTKNLDWEKTTKIDDHRFYYSENIYLFIDGKWKMC